MSEKEKFNVEAVLKIKEQIKEEILNKIEMDKKQEHKRVQYEFGRLLPLYKNFFLNGEVDVRNKKELMDGFVKLKILAEKEIINNSHSPEGKKKFDDITHFLSLIQYLGDNTEYAI